ncbi:MULTISPECIES: cyclodehydratase [Mycobacterium]|uniref:Cyclodehydratase n=1 Tax=Mycobacterium syngnathidarum TaxID=1908205 RepID=A0A1S1K6Z0_9MYCO|nr:MULTISPECIES: cyclodehydratase [Mycobacterium]MCG7609437.1 cyclodehydratase [Mycobacterium sp. CnD-18-1]OHU01650.1 cyclodehydratase [Mycobacterium syngnathidarum]OLT87199.1 cyclodehydratase [Mycobacterium syngnathidarum]
MTRYVLAAGRQILLRPDEAVQLGWDPRRAVLVRPPGGMTQNQLADLLRCLQTGATRDELVTAADPFDDTEAIDELIDALTAAGMLTALRTRRARPSRSASIRIHGRGPLSELLANGLRCSGAKVRRSTNPHTTTVAAATDLVVLADDQVNDPRLLQDLHRDGIAHLSVCVRDGAGLVGPLVIPGLTCCLHCTDLHRTDRDAAWPVLATQLRGAVGSAGRATVLATAALALHQVDLVIRAVGRPGEDQPAPDVPPTLNTTLELGADGYTIIARHWSRHPDCPC